MSKEAPINLRVATTPYPHLEDDEGCVLGSDYMHAEKVAFILEAVREKIGRDRTTR